MKAIVIAAIITGFSIGSVFAHAPEGRQDADVLHAGIGTECWMETERGDTYEVCGTIFNSIEVVEEGRGE
jgi:hypothetical protein